MKSKQPYIPVTFPDTMIVTSSVSYIDDSGNEQNKEVLVEKPISEIHDSLMSPEMFPSLETQFKAGVSPDFVNPMISTVTDPAIISESNESALNHLLEQHSNVLEESNNNIDSSNNNNNNPD